MVAQQKYYVYIFTVKLRQNDQHHFRPCAMDDGTKNYLFKTLQEVIIETQLQSRNA